MPKDARSITVKLKHYVQELKDETLSTDGKVLICSACQTSVSATQRFLVKQRISTSKHQANKMRNTSQRQVFLTEPAISNERSAFNTDLCRAFISADIPLYKVNNTCFCEFLKKYMPHRIPDESTLRRNYTSAIYEETMVKIREEIKDGPIWVSLDETTDKEGRLIGNVVIGSTSGEFSELILLTCELMEKCNHKTVSKVFNDAMGVLWPDASKHEKVLLFVSDAAPYMIRAGEALTVMYPKMIHVTCVTHALHRIAEVVRSSYPKVDLLISSLKKVFPKAPSRIQVLREMFPDMPLPPKPLVTRWGMWLEAVEYYARNIDPIKNILDALDSESATSIEAAKSVVNNKSVKNELAYIQANFSCIPKAILKNQNQHLTLPESVDIVEKAVEELRCANGKLADVVKTKLDSIFSKNPAYKEMCKISAVLNGESSEVLGSDLSPADIANFKHAPVTSCDVERSFSQYKAMLRDNRRSFTFGNLRQRFVTYCFGNRQ